MLVAPTPVGSALVAHERRDDPQGLDVDVQHRDLGRVPDLQREPSDRDRVGERRVADRQVGRAVEVGTVGTVHLAPSTVAVGAEPEVGLLQVAEQQELADAPLGGEAQHVVDPVGFRVPGDRPTLVLPTQRHVVSQPAGLPARREAVGG